MTRNRSMYLMVAAVLLSFASGVFAEPTTQERFERSVPRVSKWVAGLLGVEGPLEAAVEVLDADAFAERAGAGFFVPPGELPPALIAVTTEEGEILVSGPMFELLAERAKESGLFADDVVTLILAHELTHVAQFDRLPTVKPGPDADVKLLERLVIASVVREAQAVFVQHHVASLMDDESFEQFSRDLIASTPFASTRSKLIAETETLFCRAHESGGSDAVWEIVQNPPATAAEIMEQASPRIELADRIKENLFESIGPGDWAGITREGLPRAVGQAWGWLMSDAQQAITDAVDGAFLVSLIDRTSDGPRMVSVSVFEFADAAGAKLGPELLEQPLALQRSLFDYKPDGTKRRVLLAPVGGAEGWFAISEDTIAPGGGSMFASYGVKVRGRYMLVFYSVAGAENADHAARLMNAVDRAF